MMTCIESLLPSNNKMNQPPTPLRNISDTAFLVATYREIESERPDAIFKDPYAALLSGDQGRRIVKSFNGNKNHSWFLVARTSILDGWILELIKSQNIDTVLNLAAGLDTRAYRLNLPTTLKWYDVDLPEILSYKENQLAPYKPNCILEYVKLNLADVSARNLLFKKIAGESQNTLVVSEGFLMYLTPEIAASLAKDLSQFPQFKYWLAELLGPYQLRWIKLKWGKQFEQANAVMNFAPAEGPDFFIPCGWNPEKFKSSLLEAVRLKRAPLGAKLLTSIRILLPKFLVKRLNTAGIALMKNSKDKRI